jgi:hypothetical protein
MARDYDAHLLATYGPDLDGEGKEDPQAAKDRAEYFDAMNEEWWS